MQPLHRFFAILTCAIWGSNFVFIQAGLGEMSPFLLCALRFCLACIPAVFFIKKPNIPFRLVFLYGFTAFVLQFVLLFAGMEAGMPAGLTSLVIQIQLFFSILFARTVLGEKPHIMQIIGSAIALTGISIVCLRMGEGVSLLGLLLVIGAAASWGISNIISKKIGDDVNVIALIAWGSLVAAPILVALSLVIDGPEKIITSLKQISLVGGSAIFYIVYVSTWLGYGLWNWLLNKYPVSTVIPFSLLVPVFGMLTSILVFHEPLQSWKIMATIFIMTGLVIHVSGPRLIGHFRREREVEAI